MVVNHNGICMSQKQEPRLCLIQPFIDLQQRIMVIKAEGVKWFISTERPLGQLPFSA
jgi:molybdenum cofactor sulfurtransferase